LTKGREVAAQARAVAAPDTSLHARPPTRAPTRPSRAIRSPPRDPARAVIGGVDKRRVPRASAAGSRLKQGVRQKRRVPRACSTRAHTDTSSNIMYDNDVFFITRPSNIYWNSYAGAKCNARVCSSNCACMCTHARYRFAGPCNNATAYAQTCTYVHTNAHPPMRMRARTHAPMQSLRAAPPRHSLSKKKLKKESKKQKKKSQAWQCVNQLIGEAAEEDQ